MPLYSSHLRSFLPVCAASVLAILFLYFFSRLSVFSCVHSKHPPSLLISPPLPFYFHHCCSLLSFPTCPSSLPLRFWVNIIKNPEFIFDIHKSASVDSCLTVVAQAYIDGCSTSELQYTKDTPSARLLYVNEVQGYKKMIRE